MTGWAARPCIGRGAGHHGDRRRRLDLDIVVRGESVHQHLELESRFVEGLHAHAGRALAGVAEAHDDLFAFFEIAAHHADEQGLVPRADIALAVVFDVQHRAIAGFDGRSSSPADR